jgi:cytoskeletal protein CcmA (bactofilin family)
MMATRRKLMVLGLIVVALIWLGIGTARRIFERPVVDSEHVIFRLSDDYRLESTVNEPLVVVSNDISLASDSQVQGDTALVGDAVLVEGQVSGDLTLMGDTLTINPTSRVSGDVSLVGSDVVVGGTIDGSVTVIGDTLTITSDAQISGDVTACVDVVTDERVNGQIRPCSDSEALGSFFRTLDDATRLDSAVAGAVGSGLSVAALLFSGFTSLLLAGISGLVVAAFPRHISYIEEAMLTIPRRMGRIGILTFLLAVGIGVAVIAMVAVLPPVGLVVLPVALIAGLAFLAMTVAGWITVALVVGNWLLRRSSRSVLPPLVVASAGSVLLFMVWHILALIPLGLPVALVLMAVLGSVGLGAVVKTRLGTRPVRRSYFVQG